MSETGTQEQTDHQPGQVRRRRVFYIPGYDPFHPRRYRELYRSESRVQAAISGYDIAQKPKQGEGPYGWHVEATIEGRDVQSDVEVLYWSDIVRESMNISVAQAYWLLIRTAWVYISSGSLWRLMRLRKGPLIAAFYPVGMLLLQLIVALFAGFLAYSIVSVFAHPILGVIASWPVIGGLLRWFKRNDNKFYAYYLMHDYAYSSATRGANPPALEARIRSFGDEVAKALTDDVDEVLVVGHSYGAHIGVSILSDLLREGRVPANGPALGLLSLGHVIPMVSFLPEAKRLRADLQFLSERDDITWVDVTAPGDGCAFALCDPVAVSGVATENQRWPLVFSAAFTQSLKPETWKAKRWHFFQLHFQYLCAFDAPKDYDYFQITAGPRTLGDRYAGRASSKSLKTRPQSPYTSMAA
ncbi:hypothetical protein [Pseudoruegeria sp. SHC-113]|uniref:hypothetical protein n=1 Tax=Pseudoruegeria sp. SHC-113 TaxID=2855439 RepID=UPI0021BB6429|nr:hypothetical protein [Pseudoruegeria sp. SHC-113]MCT8160343.1 hypothetical protein [Pseudoruegeria sp. SHC-113]